MYVLIQVLEAFHHLFMDFVKKNALVIGGAVVVGAVGLYICKMKPGCPAAAADNSKLQKEAADIFTAADGTTPCSLLLLIFLHTLSRKFYCSPVSTHCYLLRYCCASIWNTTVAIRRADKTT